MQGQERTLSKPMVAAALAVMALVLLLPVLRSGEWWFNDDLARYPILLEEFTRVFLNGTIYPRWLPAINGGYGYPTFVYYQPGIFYLAMPFVWLGVSEAYAMHAAMALLLFAGAGGAYRLARRHLPPVESLLMAGIFMATPQLMINYYLRGDLSEAGAMLLCPWLLERMMALLDVTRAGQARGRVMMSLVAVLVAIIVMHPFVAFFALLFASAWFACMALCDRALGMRFMLVGAALIIAALAITSPYWFTLFQMKSEVRFETGTEGKFRTVENLFGWLHVALSLLRPHYILAAVGFYAAWRKPEARLIALALVAGIFMTSELSAFVWAHLRLLDVIQFPWRILSFTACLQLYGMVQLAQLAPKLGARNMRMAMVYGLLVTLVLSSDFWQIAGTANYAQLKAKEQAKTLNTYTVSREFDPRSFSPDGLENRASDAPMLEPGEGGENMVIGGDLNRKANHWHFTIMPRMDDVPQTACPVQVYVQQAYFPGWQVTLDGAPLPVDTSGAACPRLSYDVNGVIMLYLPLRESLKIEAAYDGPPGWLARNCIAMLILLAVTLWLALQAKPRNHSAKEAA